MSRRAAPTPEKVRGGPPGMPLVSKAAWDRHVAAELELRGQKPAARAAKVTSREVAKDGSHAVLILPDSHHPYHCPEAMAVVEHVASIVRPRRIVSLGDWLDCPAFTAHAPRSIAEEAVHTYGLEVECGGSSIDRIYQAAGGADVVEEWVYLSGNHEAHVERECVRLGALGRSILDLVSPQKLLQRGRPWLKWVPYVEPYAKDRRAPALQRGAGMPHYEIAWDLWAIHGWTTAEHAAAKHLQQAGTVSVVHGHTHRQQSVSKRLLEDDRIVKAWSPGCLSDLQPAWHHTSPTHWTRGFSLVYATDNCRRRSARSSWTEYNVTIDRGHCVLPGGTSVRA